MLKRPTIAVSVMRMATAPCGHRAPDGSTVPCQTPSKGPAANATPTVPSIPKLAAMNDRIAHPPRLCIVRTRKTHASLLYQSRLILQSPVTNIRESPQSPGASADQIYGQQLYCIPACAGLPAA